MSADPVQAVAEAHPNYATGSHEGVRCLGCNAPIAAPGGSYTMGWNLHLIEAAVAAARPAIEREAKAAAWDEGFTRGFYDVLAGGDRDASESAAENPYRGLAP